MPYLCEQMKYPAGRVDLMAGDFHWSVVVNKKTPCGNFNTYDYGLMSPDVATNLYERIGQNLKRMSVDAADEERQSCAFFAEKITMCMPEKCPYAKMSGACWEEVKQCCHCRVR